MNTPQIEIVRVEPVRKRSVCSWCEAPPTEIDLDISHGICPQCLARLLGEVGR